MATSVSATGCVGSSFYGSWGSSMAGEEYSMLAKSSQVRFGRKKGLRMQPMMKNVNEGKGIFAPIVVVTRNIIGKKRFNQLRGKAIALHSQELMQNRDRDKVSQEEWRMAWISCMKYLTNVSYIL
ncbi:protein PROTON GRADIENT REGULATION 5, chloroplastic-like isoform X2 [Arachis stenosperma]|uniref:protein PROTON GRADIENT REGULATION 5, chloroplastic-like isoform X2 n=1 Tax=Arachis stenosperma TaxID=217475 RepID=UPI0025AD14A9|nr:protein PROTON GRADIENT REGULATION 5, chloroplastic-like isoform X2 [Arachis stenosperma]